jgi:predicted ABC-type ATPase
VKAEIDEIVTKLETISEELADLALARLRETVDAGGTEIPVDEKLLTRARRAVEKAMHILREAEDHEGAFDDG